MLLWVMSDRAIPRSFRFMEGFGVHTFRFVNAAGRSTFVKFHWKPKQGMQSVLWDEAVKINGADPDFHRRDLWDAIQQGDFPEWELCIQLFDDGFADKFDFDVLDATKLIPEELLPVRPIGRLVLDRTVDNFFAETEQVAFCTQNIVPGVDFTNDPLLQGRNFSYLDTQLKRLGGPNFTHIPVNAPKCPMAHFQQDGHMAMLNPVGRANYEPNSCTGADARASRGSRRAGSRSFRGRGGRPEATAASRELRRPLQPGRAVLPQPDARRAAAHRRRVHVRAEQGARSPRSASGWSPTCATSTRVSPPGSPPASVSPSCRRRREPAPPADHRPATVAGAQHPRQRPAVVRRAARWACSSPTAPMPTLLKRAAGGAEGREGANLEIIAPADRRRHHSTTATARRRPDGRRRPIGALRRGGGARVGRGRGSLAAEPAAQGLRHRRPRPQQVHRIRRRSGEGCSHAVGLGGQDGRGLSAMSADSGGRKGGSWPSVVRCAWWERP